MSVRWTFYDPAVPETYLAEINPNEASSPYVGRNLNWSPGTATGTTGLDRVRAADLPQQQAKEWTFSGVIRTKAHHDELLRWAQKARIIRISDHLGRTFEVVIRSYLPVDRRPTPTVPWRGTYQMTCLLIGEIG